MYSAAGAKQLSLAYLRRAGGGNVNVGDLHDFAIHQRLVHDLTGTTLFRALEIHHYLDAVKGDAELSTIESFFQPHTKRFEKQFETLRQEFSGKRKRPNGHAG